jgi:transcriptional regulator with XRE-family HTH domain
MKKVGVGFSVIITELRKEKGVSQKEAARELNVSQALLSHYEKGIRECGLDFLCKAADYYGVTTDYLLGRSTSKFGFNDAFDISYDIEDDKELSTITSFRAISKIRENMRNAGFEYGDRLLYIYAMSAYRVIIYGIRSGQLPRNWISDKVPIHNDIFVKSVENALLDLVGSNDNKENASYKDVPICVQTVIKYAEKYLASKFLSVESFISNVANLYLNNSTES